MTNRIRQLSSLGQAIWLDFISRDLLESGGLRELVDKGVQGVTSNPTIFQKAIAAGDTYDEQIRGLAAAGKTDYEIYEAIALDDVRQAADQLRGVYNETHGRDGFVSIEVNPDLAHDTEGTIEEARRLFRAISRPNVMIKVPATPAGLPAITTLIGEGINVNVTLIFAVEVYQRVMNAYLDGLRQYRTGHDSPWLVSSVASFFVSRVDTLVDGELEKRIKNGEDHLAGLMGQAAVANAKVAYARYKEVFEGDAFAEFRAAGARPQRPLWASTSTKNPEYPDTKYVDPLVGVNTVNTLPPNTLEALEDHAVVAQTIEQDLDQAEHALHALEEAGIDMRWVTGKLLEDGVAAFDKSFKQLLADVAKKRATLAAST